MEICNQLYLFTHVVYKSKLTSLNYHITFVHYLPSQVIRQRYNINYNKCIIIFNYIVFCIYVSYCYSVCFVL